MAHSLFGVYGTWLSIRSSASVKSSGTLESHIVRLELEPNQTSELSLDYKWPLAEIDLDWLAADRDKFGLNKNLMESVTTLQDELMSDRHMTPEMLRRDLVTLRNFLINELDSRKFVYLATRKTASSSRKPC